MPQTDSPRVVVAAIDKEFQRLHSRRLAFVETIPPHVLYAATEGLEWSIVGEGLLRSAAAVEQTCGGLLSNLWDDPFEWTLAETLSSTERIREYFQEVESTRSKTFAGFGSDTDLTKDVATPAGTLRPVVFVLIETLVRASDHFARAQTKALDYSAESN